MINKDLGKDFIDGIGKANRPKMCNSFRVRQFWY